METIEDRPVKYAPPKLRFDNNIVRIENWMTLADLDWDEFLATPTGQAWSLAERLARHVYRELLARSIRAKEERVQGDNDFLRDRAALMVEQAGTDGPYPTPEDPRPALAEADNYWRAEAMVAKQASGNADNALVHQINNTGMVDLQIAETYAAYADFEEGDSLKKNRENIAAAEVVLPLALEWEVRISGASRAERKRLRLLLAAEETPKELPTLQVDIRDFDTAAVTGGPLAKAQAWSLAKKKHRAAQAQSDAAESARYASGNVNEDGTDPVEVYSGKVEDWLEEPQDPRQDPAKPGKVPRMAVGEPEPDTAADDWSNPSDEPIVSKNQD